MDRRKKEVTNIVKNLQEECNITVELLNKLLSKCRSQADTFNNLDPKDLNLRTGRFLAFTQFQNGIIQKLLQFDITLEELIDDVERPGNSLVDLPSQKDTTELKKLSLETQRELPDANTQRDSLYEEKLDRIHNYLNDVERQSPLPKEINGSVEIVHKDAVAGSVSSSEYYCCSDDVKVVDDVKTGFELDVATETSSKMELVEEIIPECSGPLINCYEKMDPALREIRKCEPVKKDDFVMMGYIESPTEFYIQVITEQSVQLDELSNLLESSVRWHGPYTSKQEAMRSLGQYCCMALYDYWYRVEVLDWCMDSTDDTVVMQLIDFGKICDDYTYKDLRFLPQDAFLLPRMAQLCHLEGVHPMKSGKDDKWSHESITFFSNVCGDLNSVFRITYVSPLNERNSYGVVLVKCKGQQDIDIRETFLSKYATCAAHDGSVIKSNFILKQLRLCHGLQDLKGDASTNELLETYFGRDKLVEAGNVNEAVMGYDPQDEARTCKNLRADSTCYKGNSCKFRHVPLRDGFTMDKIPTYNKAFAELQMPEENEEIFLRITEVISIQRFYAQIWSSSDSSKYRSPLPEFVNTMNDTDTVKAYKKLCQPPACSQLVIVKLYEKWYRAQVTLVNIPENDNDEITAHVFVVDFGSTIVTKISDLREMPEDFLYLPFQAVECRIYNIRCKSEIDEPTGKKYLEGLCLSSMHKATVISSKVQSHLHVHLYTQDGADVSEIISANGYGELATESYIPNEDEKYLID